MSTQFRLPDLFILTPFSALKGFHESYTREDRSSTEWALSYDIAPHKHDILYASEPELLANISYNSCSVTKERLRIIGNYLALLFVIDELTDDQDGEGAATTRGAFIKALNPNNEDNETDTSITRMTAEFVRCLSGTSETFRERFFKHLTAYIEATASEAKLRTEGRHLDCIEELSLMRRDNGGVWGAFDLIEFSLGIELPVEVFDDMNFMRVYCAANDMINYSNDIYSYANEYNKKIEAVNSVAVIMIEKGFSLQQAVDYVAKSYKEFGDIIVEYRKRIRSYGPEADEDIQRFIDGLQQWVIGNLEWSFQSGRYFGKYSEDVRRTGVIELEISYDIF